MKPNAHFWSYIIPFFLEWRIFQTHLEKIKTDIWCSITCSKNCAVCEITWKNILELNRLQMTAWLMRIACWIPEATNTDSECVIRFASPLQQWLHECASLLHQTYIASIPPPFPHFLHFCHHHHNYYYYQILHICSVEFSYLYWCQRNLTHSGKLYQINTDICTHKLISHHFMSAFFSIYVVEWY